MKREGQINLPPEKNLLWKTPALSGLIFPNESKIIQLLFSKSCELMNYLWTCLRWFSWLIWNCFFMNWFYYNLIIQVKLCKIHTKIWTKLYCFWESRYFVWKFENFDKLQPPNSSIVFHEISHMFLTYQSLQKDVRDFFILFRSWVACKKLKRPGFYILFFLHYY